MKKFVFTLLTAATLALPVFAPTTAPAAAAAAVDGEVRKIDKDAKKITIRHGEIKNLDMPSMTMVFQVNDAAELDKFKSGDKIQFKAERSSGGAFMASEIKPAAK